MKLYTLLVLLFPILCFGKVTKENQNSANLVILTIMTNGDLRNSLAKHASTEDTTFIDANFKKFRAENAARLISKIERGQIYISGIKDPFILQDHAIKHRGLVYKIRANESLSSAFERYNKNKVSLRAPLVTYAAATDIGFDEKFSDDSARSAFYALILVSYFDPMLSEDQRARYLSRLAKKPIIDIKCLDSNGNEPPAGNLDVGIYNRYQFVFEDGTKLDIDRKQNIKAFMDKHPTISELDDKDKISVLSSYFLPADYCDKSPALRQDIMQELFLEQKSTTPSDVPTFKKQVK